MNPYADKYIYKGLYVVEDDISYRLFSYIDELKGTEEPTALDFDKDGDEDQLILISGELFLKENRKNKTVKSYVTDAPLLLTIGNNKFFNNSLSFLPAINNLKETEVSDGYLNFSFSSERRKEVANYHIEFYPIVDKLYSLIFGNFIPEGIKKYVIDGFSDTDDITILDEQIDYIQRNHLVSLTYI